MTGLAQAMMVRLSLCFPFAFKSLAVVFSRVVAPIDGSSS